MGQPLGDELSLLPYEGALLNKTFLAFYTALFCPGEGYLRFVWLRFSIEEAQMGVVARPGSIRLVLWPWNLFHNMIITCMNLWYPMASYGFWNDHMLRSLFFWDMCWRKKPYAPHHQDGGGGVLPRRPDGSALLLWRHVLLLGLEVCRPADGRHAEAWNADEHLERRGLSELTICWYLLTFNANHRCHSHP